jgi:hypothetical protein
MIKRHEINIRNISICKQFKADEFLDFIKTGNVFRNILETNANLKTGINNKRVKFT